MPFTLGNKTYRHGICLAPMAGYSDRGMRLICHRLGAELAVSEMISAKAVTFGDKKTFELARILPDEGDVAIQIFGSEPHIMAEAARVLSNPKESARPVAIDINMGCPVHKIFSNGEGSALMKSPALIEQIVSAVVKATDLPVTVKLRAGIDDSSINAVECALRAEAAGASLVTLHGRTRVQMYSGFADRKIIGNVKCALQIPLIANGDITNAEQALSMLSDTGADGIAVGRGAVGNPFIFSEIRAALEGESYTPPTLTDRVEVALAQLSTAVEEKGERRAIPEARKQIALYLQGFRGAARIRADINRATEFAEVERILLAATEESEDASNEQ